jgi:hypothetical protein
MFYIEQDINENLKCQICKNKFENPKILPCGESICNECLPVEINYSNNEEQAFICNICNQEHLISANGFPPNKCLAKLLENTPIEFYRGRSHEQLKEKSKELKHEIGQLKELIEMPKEIIKNNCNLLREQVRFSVESTEIKLAKAAEQLLKEIDNYEDQCLQDSDKNKDLFISLKIELKDLETIYNEHTDYLNKPLIEHQETADKLNTTIEKLINIIYIKINLHKSIFSDKSLKFKANEKELETCIIGKFYDSNIYFDSSTILDRFLMVKVYEVCDLYKQDKWKLIYRATRDGFSAKDFHSKCDGKYLTLTLVKTNDGYIFGGYSEREWASDGSIKYDSKANLFTLVNKKNKSMSFEIRDNYYSIKCDSSCGPVFGSGPDLCIRFNQPSTTNLGISYKNFYLTAEESKFILCDKENFELEELEVFQCFI